MNYENMYNEVKNALDIHDSHDHDRVLAYIKVYNDRIRAANKILDETSSFITRVQKIEKEAWL